MPRNPKTMSEFGKRRRALGACGAFRRAATHLAAAVLATILATHGACVTAAAPLDTLLASDAQVVAALVIESIEIEGNTRTSDETVMRYLSIAPGDAVPPDSVLAAVEALREAQIFDDVAVTLRRGPTRGGVIVALAVREKGVELRFGAGHQDLSGWYLIPAELRLDNRLGRGERLGAHLRVGYRLSGVVVFFEEPRLADRRARWGITLSGLDTDRIYFIDGVEYRHKVRRGGLELHVGRALSSRWGWDVGAGVEGIDVDSLATAHSESEVLGVERGDEIDRANLPAGVAEAVGEAQRSSVRATLTLDSRATERIAGTPAGGLWGRIESEGVANGDGSYLSATADLRGYQPFLGTVLAARVRAGIVGRAAPFYDRHYVGGLYTVRGFPSQSLSDAAGDTRFWSAALELRAPLVGDARMPRLAGVAFLEAADGWDRGRPALDDIAASAGFGCRLRMPFVGWLGVDFGIPLSTSPVDEAFHGHASLGWTY
ncbi:MAG: outer membrane protein assembly factor [bacterium]